MGDSFPAFRGTERVRVSFLYWLVFRVIQNDQYAKMASFRMANSVPLQYHSASIPEWGHLCDADPSQDTEQCHYPRKERTFGC